MKKIMFIFVVFLSFLSCNALVDPAQRLEALSAPSLYNGKAELSGAALFDGFEHLCLQNYGNLKAVREFARRQSLGTILDTADPTGYGVFRARKGSLLTPILQVEMGRLQNITNLTYSLRFAHYSCNLRANIADFQRFTREDVLRILAKYEPKIESESNNSLKLVLNLGQDPKEVTITLPEAKPVPTQKLGEFCENGVPCQMVTPLIISRGSIVSFD